MSRHQSRRKYAHRAKKTHCVSCRKVVKRGEAQSHCKVEASA